MFYKKILINTLGIQDSGGITVLRKMLNEVLEHKQYNFFIFIFENDNTIKLFNDFNKYSNIQFKFIKNRGLIYRLLFENIYFFYFIQKNQINLVYNFSGTAQFISNTKQLVKVHNLLFYSKKLDRIYFRKKSYKCWLKNIFIKRVIFRFMLNISVNIEIQSSHVKNNLSNFLGMSKKQFFLKSDFDINKNNFKSPKDYEFSKKIKFLYIVGPHFEYLHKNFTDFIKAMLVLKKENFNFEIGITLSKKQLNNSNVWDKNLDDKTNFLGYISKDELSRQFNDNTILISTSIIETLGLHVIESVSSGILAIVPSENYSRSVYGKDVFNYILFDIPSLISIIKHISSLNNKQIKNIIKKNQNYLIQNENQKNQNIVDIFDKILKDKDVQK